MEYHLESATRIYLALLCIKLNNTEDMLNKTEYELNTTKALLNETRVELKNAMALLELSSVKHNNAFLWRTDSFSDMLKETKNGGKRE